MLLQMFYDSALKIMEVFIRHSSRFQKLNLWLYLDSFLFQLRDEANSLYINYTPLNLVWYESLSNMCS